MPSVTHGPRGGPTAQYVSGRERILGSPSTRPLAEREASDVAEELAHVLGLSDAAAFVRAVHRALMNLTREGDRGA